MLPLFADLPAMWPAGTKYRYGDANFVLAGLAIEAATGEAYGDVMAEHVLSPAGMDDTLSERWTRSRRGSRPRTRRAWSRSWASTTRAPDQASASRVGRSDLAAP